MNVKEQVKIDLADACDAIEHLVELLPDTPLKASVDMAARLRGVAKAIETIDKSVKERIKNQLGHAEGTVQGGVFKAVLKYITSTRLNQAKLRDERPKIYEQYCEAKDEGRVTFEAR